MRCKEIQQAASSLAALLRHHAYPSVHGISTAYVQRLVVALDFKASSFCEALVCNGLCKNAASGKGLSGTRRAHKNEEITVFSGGYLFILSFVARV